MGLQSRGTIEVLREDGERMTMKHVSIILLLLIVVSAIADPPTSRPSRPQVIEAETIKARKFELIDDSGKTIAVFWGGARGDDPHIDFFESHDSIKIRTEQPAAPGASKPLVNKAAPPASAPAARPQIHLLSLDEHTISRVIGGGRYVELGDGSLWEVEAGEESEVNTWGGEEVVLKASEFNGYVFHELIHDDESVSVTRAK